MMMGGNHKFAISPEEYIFAGDMLIVFLKWRLTIKFSALALYLDILNIFLYILRIFGKK